MLKISNISNIKLSRAVSCILGSASKALSAQRLSSNNHGLKWQQCLISNVKAQYIWIESWATCQKDAKVVSRWTGVCFQIM